MYCLVGRYTILPHHLCSYFFVVDDNIFIPRYNILRNHVILCKEKSTMFQVLIFIMELAGIYYQILVHVHIIRKLCSSVILLLHIFLCLMVSKGIIIGNNIFLLNHQSVSIYFKICLTPSSHQLH